MRDIVSREGMATAGTKEEGEGAGGGTRHQEFRLWVQNAVWKNVLQSERQQ